MLLQLILLYSLDAVRSCAPIISSPSKLQTLASPPTTTTPPMPMNADYYDDINLHLTQIDTSKMMAAPLAQPPMISKGNMIIAKPPQPKPLPLLPVLRDMRPLPLEKSAKTFSSLFDFWKPFATLPPMNNLFSPKDTPFGNVPRLQPLVSRRSILKFKASPPVSWTFCEPICGSGDQAVDTESAWDNADVDIKEGLASAFNTLHLPPLRDDQVKISYAPKSTQLEEFGDKYDYSGFRYETIANAVAFRRHKEDSAKNGQYSVDVKVEIQHNNINSGVLKQVAHKLSTFLQLNKGARIVHEILIEPQ